jgi:hypothetical protein
MIRDKRKPYGVALRLEPHNPIAATNLARLLLKTDDPDLSEIERLLQRAQMFADRRFTWWRPAWDELQRRQSKAILEASSTTKTVTDRSLTKLRQVRQQFRKIANLEDKQQRGHHLEHLLYELSKLTLHDAEPSYYAKREAPNGIIRQIDGFFRCDGEKYRVECKWLEESTDQNDLNTFRLKLNVAGISGLFISMSGFKATAIAMAN